VAQYTKRLFVRPLAALRIGHRGWPRAMWRRSARYDESCDPGKPSPQSALIYGFWRGSMAVGSRQRPYAGG